MNQLVLSLFPGADLLGRAFEFLGWCVVRGPDVLWGGDVRTYRVPRGAFAGVIGGPPCQIHSNAARLGTDAEDRIPEFLRIVAEADPDWAVMENVPLARPEMAGWDRTTLRDWDCGGLTFRERAFWLRGLPLMLAPPPRPGRPEHSVLATNWRIRTGKKGKGGTQGMHQTLSVEDAGRLQGWPGLGETIAAAQPGGVTGWSRRCLAIHMLGNGVPRAMAQYVAEHVTRYAWPERWYGRAGGCG